MEKYNGEAYQRRGLWWIKYRHEGKEYRQSVARLLRMPKQAVTAKHAKQALEEQLRALYQDRFVDPRHGKVTLGDCLEQLVVTMELAGNKSLAETSSTLARLKAQLGHYRATDVETHVIARWAKEWLTTWEPATVRKWCGYVCAALRLAVKQGRVTKAPAEPEIRVDNARQGFLSAEQVAAIAAVLRTPTTTKHEAAAHRDREPYADAVEWAFCTAWRRGEIIGLQWPHVDRVGGQITLVDTKNKDRRVLPIIGPIAELVERRWRARGLGVPWVFHRSGRRLGASRLNAHFKRAATAAGLPDRIFHDLRRSAVREMELAGVPRTIAMKISGHRSESIYKRYAITNTQDIAEALRKLDKTRTIPGFRKAGSE